MEGCASYPDLECVRACVIVCRDQAEAVGRKTCERLKKALSRQQFEVAIQAMIGSKVRKTTVECMRMGSGLHVPLLL